MKYLKIIVVAAIFMLTLTGCGAKDKEKEEDSKSIFENIFDDDDDDDESEAITEEILEDASGGEVDIDGDTITVTDETGATMTFGTTDWPTSELVKTIPEFKDGVITSVTDSQDLVMISMEQVKKEDYQDYLEGIKEDYDQESFETTMSDFSSYGGYNSEGIIVQLYYESETEYMTISISREIEQLKTNKKKHWTVW